MWHVNANVPLIHNPPVMEERKSLGDGVTGETWSLVIKSKSEVRPNVTGPRDLTTWERARSNWTNAGMKLQEKKFHKSHARLTPAPRERETAQAAALKEVGLLKLAAWRLR